MYLLITPAQFKLGFCRIDRLAGTISRHPFVTVYTTEAGNHVVLAPKPEETTDVVQVPEVQP